MTAGRWTLFATVLIVGCLAVAFVFLSSDIAGQVEAAVTALGAVAAIGTGIWAALPRGSAEDPRKAEAIAKGTGPAVADGPGSSANSGVRGSGVASGTGRVTARGGGSANSGVDSSERA